MIQTLTPEQLRRTSTKEEIAELMAKSDGDHPPLVGQDRAAKALEVGLGIRAEGFNVFVSGEQGTGKLHAVKMFMEKTAAAQPVPPDWCYVYNFGDGYSPKRLSLPAGRGTEFRKDMKKLVQEALQSLFKTFESEDFLNRRRTISDKYENLQMKMNASLKEKASSAGFQIKQTHWDIYTIPMADGVPMSDEDFDALPENKRHEIEEKQQAFADEIKDLMLENRKLEREANEELAKLDSEVAGFAVSLLIEEREQSYRDLPEVLAHLQAVKKDILDNLGEFLIAHKPQQPGEPVPARTEYLRRYDVNLLVDNVHQKGAPIVIEQNPTYNNLVGRVEKESVMGTLVTDFTMIRKGSLHEANGGYLIIRAEQLFRNYFSWDALKRALRNRQVVIEEATDQLGYLTTKTLKPEAIPLDVKVVLVGSPLYYHILYRIDPDFKVLFKVKADFDSEMERNGENLLGYLRFAQRLAKRESLPPPEESALARLTDLGSRLAEDQGKLSTRFDNIGDVLIEAGHYAKQEGSERTLDRHVTHATEQRIYRSNLVKEKLDEMVDQRQVLIELSGSREGQVNGLSVVSLGDIHIGRPVRITSTVNPGRSGVIDIEREAELSGPIHTKGVLILNGFLAERYFQDKPACLSARLVFEQSYSEVEGDSASSTELYALLSNLANLPVKQGIAVTGSVNQKGEVQAIGGVNEKVEGFFELCRKTGLTGEQGVIIPSANRRHLMLKEDVQTAVKEGRFHIWTVDTIDDGIEILTGTRAGNIAEEGTVNHLVNKTLQDYHLRMRESEEEEEEKESHTPDSGRWVTDVV
jgi:predicted ATP-dependent protease